MSLTVHLLVDSRGWPTALDPEVVNAILQARLRTPLDVHAYELGPRWFLHLPAEEAAVFLFLTRPLTPGWVEPLREWLDSEHCLWAVYINDASLSDVREVAALTSGQAVPRAPYRIAQPTPVGLERAVQWIESILTKLLESTSAPPPVKIAQTRWRNLPSDQRDSHAYPDQVNLSSHGAAGYKLAAASYRGKSHAHNGTFREDAVALATTRYWNIIAVGDGAGTAPMARVGSNLAVMHAVEAMRYAMPDTPSAEDIGRAIWAGLKAAHTAILDFAAEQDMMASDLHTTLQLLIHWPQPTSCLLGLAHVGDGIIAAETVDGQYYILTEPDTDPDDSGRTLFLTSGPVRQWMERTKVYQFDERLEIVAMMTDGLSGDLEPYAERLPTHLFEPLRQRVLCYPLRQREQALLAFISYDRRGSFDDRTLAVLSRD